MMLSRFGFFSIKIYLVKAALLWLVACSSAVATGAPNENTPLARHSSPYIRMHANDPVHWQLWDRHILQEAQEQHKLIFISSGFFACHWCHVMQQETFSDPAIAELLNANFISIKIDREQHQALDKQLLEFVRRLRGYSGWPLNVVLTPEGYPITGFVYLPPEDFTNTLKGVLSAWNERADSIRQLSRAAAQELADTMPQGKAAVLDEETFDQRFIAAVDQKKDDLQGGFGMQAKFARVPLMRALLDYVEQHHSAEIADFVRLTLDQMADMGLRDHINGGFFRYTTEPGWLQPHYEKMLYDNALLVSLYTQAARVLEEPRYLAVARDTADALLTQFKDDGLLVASISAVDGQGREGATYLWTWEEIRRAVKDPGQRAFIKAWFGLGEEDAMPHQLVPAATDTQLKKQFSLDESALQARKQAIRLQLQQAGGRPHHAVDNKHLLGWNSLAVVALLDLSRQLSATDGKRYQELALSLFTRIKREFNHNGQWYRQAGEHQAVKAELEDMAYWADAVMHVYQVTHDPDLLQELELVLSKCWSFYEAGSWQLSSTSTLPWAYAAPALPDRSLPAAPAVVIRVTKQLGELSPESISHFPLLQAWNNARAMAATDPTHYASYR